MGSKQVLEIENKITRLKQKFKAIPSGLSKKVEEKLQGSDVYSNINQWSVEVKEQVNECTGNNKHDKTKQFCIDLTNVYLFLSKLNRWCSTVIVRFISETNGFHES